MFKLTVFITLLLLSYAGVFAQRQLPAFNASRLIHQPADLNKQFHQFTAVKLDPQQLNGFVKGKSTASFHLSLGENINWDLELVPVSITSPSYTLSIQTADGLHPVPYHATDFLFKGKVKGSKGGEVRLTIKDNFIYGCIADDEKEYFIEPLKRFSSLAAKYEFVVYESKDIIKKDLDCGVNDAENTIRQQQQSSKEESEQDVICRKINFVSAADYSIYQKFNYDVEAVETWLLSSLNLAEGAFTTLNFGPDGSKDIGEDQLEFEATNIIVSVCPTCDMIGKSEEMFDILNDFNRWVLLNKLNSPKTITQFWSTRFLYRNNTSIIGYAAGEPSCTGAALCTFRYDNFNAAFMRTLIAHETGHSLGCPHDDDVKGSVRSFIMFSGATEINNRFSTLADFGGTPYSSQQTIRSWFLYTMNCLDECGAPACEIPEKLSVTLFDSGDSVRITWKGEGVFLARFKPKDSATYTSANTRTVQGNTIVLKNVLPCGRYTFQVQKQCTATTYGPAASIEFTASNFNFTAKAINNRANLYDLQIDVDCKNCGNIVYAMKIDRLTYPFETGTKQLFVRNILPDGALHKIDLQKTGDAGGCTSTVKYTAPYYRSDATIITAATFEECKIPAGWKDSILFNATTLPNPRWSVRVNNNYYERTTPGSLDSTCMIYYNNHSNLYKGALSLISPVADLSSYSNVYLHFDYNFLAYKPATGAGTCSFWIEAFNGTQWEKAFFYTNGDRFPIGRTGRNMWDSVPQRVFVNVSQYKNKDFQFRFVVDDGSILFGRSTPLFIAFDNIVLDGYLPGNNNSNDFIVFPNPFRDEFFIRFKQIPAQPINYIISDIQGKMISRGTMTNDRIPLKGVSAGVYFLKLYKETELIGVQKIIQQ